MLTETQQEIIRLVIDERPDKVAFLGMCRVWTGVVLDEIEFWAVENGLGVVAEAREVKMRSGIEHTFVRLIIVELLPMVLDGTGVEGFPPYFGLEEDAPEHLRNSKVDNWIMKDRMWRS